LPGSTARIYKQLLSLLKLKIPHNDKFTEGLKFKYTSDCGCLFLDDLIVTYYLNTLLFTGNL